nr:unnamed protein product [Callosobruchus chinensis]CAH7765658.1 unnamed protein product [Callosobruchus chinensis]
MATKNRFKSFLLFKKIHYSSDGGRSC